jgi:hypothetical protein
MQAMAPILHAIVAMAACCLVANARAQDAIKMTVPVINTTFSRVFAALEKGADLKVILINSSDPQFTLWSFDPAVQSIDGL